VEFNPNLRNGKATFEFFVLYEILIAEAEWFLLAILNEWQMDDWNPVVGVGRR